MKTGLSLTEWAQKIEENSKAKHDYLVPTDKVEMVAHLDPGTDVALDLGVDGIAPLTVNDHAHDQIAASLEIPRPYYRRMLEKQPALLAENVNGWLHAEPKVRLARTLHSTARAWLSDRYRPLDNERVVEFLAPTFEQYGHELVALSSEITERRLYLKMGFPKRQGEVKKGDIVQGGFIVENSEVGAGALSVKPFLMRLVCINGMVIDDLGTRRNHVGKRIEIEAQGFEVDFRDDTVRADDKAIMLRLRDTVTSIISPDGFERVIAHLRGAAESSEMKHPEKAVEVARKQLGLTQEESGSVLAHLIRGGDLSAWGLANAVTRAAADVESYDRATELERIGFGVIQMVQDGGGAWEAVASAK